MKQLLVFLLLGIAPLSNAQQSSDNSAKKFHTYLITENMGIFPKSEGVLNVQLVQNLKGIGVMEDKKTNYDLEVVYYVIKYTYKGQSPIEFPVEGSEFPVGLRNKFFANAKSGDKITIDQIRIRNSEQYKGLGEGVTVMEYVVK